MTKFKCNYCETVVPVRMYGADKITCKGCGARYIKQQTIQIIEE